MQELASIIDVLPDPAFTINRAGRVTAWNQAMQDLTGVAARDILGKGDYEYALPFYGHKRPMLIDLALAPRPDLEKTYAAIQRQGDILVGENYVPHLKGGTFLLGTAGLLRDSQGQVIGAIETLRDITAHRQTEEQLAVFRALAENAADAILIGDRQARVTYANRASYDLLGYADAGQAQALLGRQLADFWTDPSFFTQHVLAQVFGPAGSWRGEIQQKKRDGSLFEAYMTAFPIQTESGQPLGLAIITRDITEAVRRRERLRLQSAALESAANAIVITDCQGNIIWVNPAFTRLTGYTEEEALHQNPRVLKSGQHDAAFYRRMWETIMAGQVWQGEIVNRRKDERLYTEEMTITPVRDERGQISHFIAIKQDITERKRLEQAAQASLERRSRQVQIVTEVAQDIAAAPALDELYARVVTLIKERLGYYHAQIFQYEPALDAMVLVAGYGEAGQRMLAGGHRLPMGRGVVGTAAALGHPILAADVTQDRDWRPNPDLPETKGELAVPIRLRAQVLGILDVQSDTAGALTQDDQLLLEGLCGQIAIAIESTRLRQETEEKLHELNMVYRAASREGWAAFRKSQAARLPSGYLFDRITIKPAEDIWTPELKQAAEQNTFAPPAPAAAVAPLTARGELIGALGVYDDPQQPMSSDDLALIESVSEQVALALESARLFEQTRTALAETEALYQANAELNAAQAYQDVLAVFRKHTLLGQADLNVSIQLFDAPWLGDHMPAWAEIVAQWTPSAVEHPVTRYKLSEFPAARALRPDQIYAIPDVETHPDLSDAQRHQWLHVFQARSVIFIPLIASGRWIGLVGALYREPTEFPEAELRRLGSIANQAASIVQSIRQLEEIQQRARRERTLREIATTISANQDFLAISLPDIAWALSELLPIDRLGVAAYRPGDVEYTLFVAEAEPVADLVPHREERLPLKGSALEWMIRHGQTRMDADLRQDMPFAGDAPLVAAGQISRLMLPISMGGEVIGALSVSSRQPAAFTQEHADLLRPVADQMAQSLERSRLLEDTRAALAEVEATHRRYLREQWDIYLATTKQALGFVDGPAGLAPLAALESSEPAGQAPASDVLSVPIRVRGETIGAFEFYDTSAARAWTDEERALAETLADQAALALENARLFEDTQSRAQREHLIGAVTAKIRASMDMAGVLRTTAEELARTLNLSRACIRLGSGEAEPEELAQGEKRRGEKADFIHKKENDT